MKKSISIIILTILFSNYCLASNIDTIRNDHSIFFEDSLAMSDLSKEKEVISRLMLVIAEFEKNGITITHENKKSGLPLNENQALRLLKCMNVAAKSKGKLLIVFVDKNSNKIINMNIADMKQNDNLYQPTSIVQFFTLLKEDKVEFKLKKSDGKFRSMQSTNESMSDYYLGNRSEYSRVSDMITNKYPVLFEESNLNIDISWEKDIDPVTKASSIPKVRNVQTELGFNGIGNYKHQDDKSNYNDETKKIIVQTNGRFEVAVNLCGHGVTLVALIKSMTIIDDNTGGSQFFAEVYKVI